MLVVSSRHPRADEEREPTGVKPPSATAQGHTTGWAGPESKSQPPLPPAFLVVMGLARGVKAQRHRTSSQKFPWFFMSCCARTSVLGFRCFSGSVWSTVDRDRGRKRRIGGSRSVGEGVLTVLA